MVSFLQVSLLKFGMPLLRLWRPRTENSSLFFSGALLQSSPYFYLHRNFSEGNKELLTY